MNVDYEIRSKIFKAFCDPKRLEILEILKSGEQCACVLLTQLKITQSGLSYHMKILMESEIVIGRQEGKWTYYCISKSGIDRAIELLENIKC